MGKLSFLSAKHVTDEQLSVNRQQILAENPKIAAFLTSAEKSSAFIKANRKGRVARNAESKEEVRYSETRLMRNHHTYFEASVEGLAYAIQGNENTGNEHKAYEICREATVKINARVHDSVSVFTTGVGHGSIMALFNLKGKDFTVFFE